MEGGKYKASFLLPDVDTPPEVMDLQRAYQMERLQTQQQLRAMGIFPPLPFGQPEQMADTGPMGIPLQTSDGLLISETVVPGFEYSDHDFMKKERLEALVTAEEAKALEWLLKKE